MSADDVRNAEAMPPAKNKLGKSRSRKLFGCALIFLAVGFVGLVVLLLFLNGPGFRIFGKAIALNLAEKQGIEGDFTIDGSIWGGFSIGNVELEGKENPLVSLKLEEATVDYDTWGLITSATTFGWLELVRIQKATVEIDLPEPSGDQKKPKEQKKSQAEPKDFSPFWNLLDAEFAFAEIDLVIKQGDKSYRIDNFSLQSNPGEDGRFTITGLELPGNEPVSPISAVLQKDEHSVSLQSWQIGSTTSLQSLTVAESKPGVFDGEADFKFAGGKFSANFSSAGKASLKMHRGTTFVLSEIPAGGEIQAKLGGRVTDLDLRFDGDFENPSTWDINGSLVASRIRWEEFAVDTVALAIQNNIATFQASLPGASVQLAASAPLENFETTEELGQIPVDLGASIDVSSVQQVIAPIAEDLPLEGKISARVENVQLVGGTTVQSGTLSIVSDSLKWNGDALNLLQITGAVESPDSLKIAADAGLDSNTLVRVSGNLNPQTLEYTATATGNFSTEGQLGNLLAKLETPPMTGNGVLKWKGEGSLKAPQHLGDATLTLAQFQVNESPPIDVTATANYQNKNIRVPSLSVRSGDIGLYGTAAWDGERATLTNWKIENGNVEKLSLSASIPCGTETPFLEQKGPVELDLDIKDLTVSEVSQLSATTLPLDGTLNGALKAGGAFDAMNVRGDFNFSPRFEGVSEDALLDIDLDLAGSASRPEDWKVDLGALISGLRWNDVDIQQIEVAASTEMIQAAKLLKAKVTANQSGSSLNANAFLDLTDAQSFEDLAKRSVGVDLQFNAPDLEPVWRDFAPGELKAFPVSGGLDLEVKDLQLVGSSVESGQVSLRSETLTLDGETLQSIDIEGSVPQSNQIVASIAILADDLSQIKGSGAYHLIEQNYDSSLSLNLNLEKDGVLKRLLKNRAIGSLLPETATATVEAKGDVKQKKIDSRVDLNIVDLALADGAEPIDLKLKGSFLDFQSASASLSVGSRILDLEGDLTWQDNVLALVDWSGTAAGTRVFSLDGSVPLNPEKLSASDWFSQKEPMELSLRTDDLSLGSIFPLFQTEAPINGSISIDLAASGSPSSPELTLDTKLVDLAVPGEKEYAVGRAEMNLTAKDQSARLNGTYRHPDVQPLSLEAQLPFWPGEWATGERNVLDEEFRASARMDKSSLSFIRTQVPGIEAIDGTVAINAKASGTLSKPNLSGTGNLDINRLRFDDRNAPDLKDIDSVIRFEDNRITLERLRAIVAGGIVEASGTAKLESGEEPQLSFNVTGSEVLVVRTPDVNVRTDADLRIAGPWSAVSISGDLGIVNSRFFKNIDLVPIGLPTARKKSSLPTVKRAPRGGGVAYTDLDFGVKVEPFQNWPLNVRIYTKTPFLIRGNLAESEIEADLTISGNLGSPTPNGFVKIAEGELSLPFSSVDVETGRIEFDPSTGFNGTVEFKARAKADSYRINIYLYNRILDPKYVLTSNPPMPSEDIMTLLATGTTRDELIGDDAASLAGSKAATLLFKNLRKTSAAEKERTVLDELEERTELEIGGVDPETGEQTFGGKIRLWKQLFFVGDVDSGSDYRALLKYVFRFR